MGAVSVLLGALHGADPDHVMEMTNFVTQDPRPWRVTGFALKFGGGHTLTVLAAGLAVRLAKSTVPEAYSIWFEVLSGLLLVALGFWVVRRTWRWVRGLALAYSPHGHYHILEQYPTSAQDAWVLSYGPVLTGVATGLAGSAAVMLLGPVAAASTLGSMTVYILLYGAGVIAFMMGYGLVVVRVLHFIDASPGWALMSRTVVAGLSVGVGGVWIYRAIAALRALF